MDIKNLVFQGGGMKGAAFAEIPLVLEEWGILSGIKKVSGSSAGAIMATLMCLKFTPEEIRNIVMNMNFQEFSDANYGIVRNLYRLMVYFGYYKGDEFSDWIRSLVTQKLGNPDATFKDLYDLNGMSLYVTGSNLTRKRLDIFSIETTPNMKIWEAVRISMSLPLYFKSMTYEGELYVDGGMLDNFPIDIFDKKKCSEDCYNCDCPCHINGEEDKCPKKIINAETLGFKFKINEEKKEEEPEPITNIFTYLYRIIDTLLSRIEYLDSTKSGLGHKVVLMRSGNLTTTGFNASPDSIRKAVQEGRHDTDQFLELLNLVDNMTSDSESEEEPSGFLKCIQYAENADHVIGLKENYGDIDVDFIRRRSV